MVLKEVVDLLKSSRAILQRHPIDVLVDDAFDSPDAATLCQWAESINSLSSQSPQCSEEEHESRLVELLARIIDMDRPANSEELEAFPPDLINLAAAVRQLSVARQCEEPELVPAAEEVVARLGLKRKKRHEVLMLSSAVHMLIQEHSVDLVIDVGSGQGYVSLAIAMLSGVEVVGIDNMEHNGEAALKRMKHVASQKDAPPCKFHTITHNIAPGEDFSHILASFISQGPRRVLLLGLHACGDLTSTFLRMAVGSLRQHIVGIMSIGCCYQNLSEVSSTADCEKGEHGSFLGRVTRRGEENDGTIIVQPGGDEADTVAGIPMSKFLQDSCEGALFGRHTRTLGAQSLSLSGDAFHWTLKRQLFRTAFQLLVYKHRGFIAPHKLGVKNKDGLELSFSSYALMAAAQCSIQEDEAEAMVNQHGEEIMAYCESVKTRLYLLWTLRALLGHCVEAMVLLDRLAYLDEHGFESSLRVVFDGDESPRNVAVVAWRKMEKFKL